MPSTSPAPQRRAFAALVGRPDAEIDLVGAALIVAGDAYPDLDPAACREELDRLAEAVRRAAGGLKAPDPPRTPGDLYAGVHQRQIALGWLRVLNEVLFEELGFQGNTWEYYDPRNSYLNEVLERRLGIPITLALVYSEVARRVGLPLHGVGLPGHFIVGYTPPGDDPADPQATIYVDPFNGGVLRSAAECVALAQGLGAGPYTRAWFAPITPRQFLARLLNNLKLIYLDAGDWAAALQIVDYLLLVQPQALDELRLRGMLYYRLGAFMPALSDLKHYLHAAPNAPDADQVRYYTQLLHNLLFAMN